MTQTVAEAVTYLDDILDRRRTGHTMAEQAEQWSRSFREFTYHAWPILGYPRLQQTWHIDALCDHVQAAYERDISRLLVSVQPGAFKSTILSVLGPAWRWTHRPGERFVTASHADDLSTRDTTKSRTLMQTSWYQARWGHLWDFADAENLKTRYSNTEGGQRLRTHVGGGTGDRGTVLQLDDPHNAREAHYADTQLQAAVEWWGDTWVSRLDDTVDHPGVLIVIGQRLHERDLIGFLLDSDKSRWTHLCLPTKYVPNHPFVYPPKVMIGGRELKGDPRTEPDELLMPAYQDADRVAERTHPGGITAHVFAGQYQQLPAPREGKMLKRSGWRYYPPDWSFYSPRGALTPADLANLPRFHQLIHSWDTSVKDRAHSDFVSGQIWGCNDADRWLLRLFHERAGLNATIEAMLTLHQWALQHWPDVPQYVVVEESANGPDAIAAIRKKVQGVIPWAAKGSKQVRAEAAAPALDGRNCFLPGYPDDLGQDYDPRTPLAVQEFVEELAAFDQGQHDDHVDGWSQMVNYSRRRGHTQASMTVAEGTV